MFEFLIILGIVFAYLLIGSFMSIPIEWAIRQIDLCANIDDEDRLRFMLLWAILLVVIVIGFVGYFPFWLSKKLAKKVFKDEDS